MRIVSAFVILALTITQATAGSVPLLGAGKAVGGGGGSLLLDTLSSSIVVAYSTRKLKSSYAGNAIQVQRSSDSTTSNIGFDGSNNLDTTALGTFCAATTCTVSIWYDQSGNAINAIPAGATFNEQPAVVITGTNQTLNGHVALVSEALGSPTSMKFSATQAQPLMLALAEKLTSSPQGDHFLDGLASSGNRVLVGLSGTAYQLYAGAVETGGTQNASTHALFALFNDPNSNLWVDGTNVIVNLPTGSNGLGTNAEQIWNGVLAATIGEIIVYAGTSATDRATIRTSWQAYWGTP